MHITPIQPVLVLCLLLTAQPNAYADSYRCGRKLVKTGDTTGDLLRLCGEPRFKDRGYEEFRLDGGQKSARVERWYYKKNSRSLEHIMLIYRGKIRAIEVGSR